MLLAEISDKVPSVTAIWAMGLGTAAVCVLVCYRLKWGWVVSAALAMPLIGWYWQEFVADHAMYRAVLSEKGRAYIIQAAISSLLPVLATVAAIRYRSIASKMQFAERAEYSKGRAVGLAAFFLLGLFLAVQVVLYAIGWTMIYSGLSAGSGSYAPMRDYVGLVFLCMPFASGMIASLIYSRPAIVKVCLEVAIACFLGAMVAFSWMGSWLLIWGVLKNALLFGLLGLPWIGAWMLALRWSLIWERHSGWKPLARGKIWELLGD